MELEDSKIIIASLKISNFKIQEITFLKLQKNINLIYHLNIPITNSKINLINNIQIPLSQLNLKL